MRRNTTPSPDSIQAAQRVARELGRPTTCAGTRRLAADLDAGTRSVRDWSHAEYLRFLATTLGGESAAECVRRADEMDRAENASAKVYAETSWSVEDLMAHRNLPRRRAAAVLRENEDEIAQASIEAGWAVVDSIIAGEGGGE